MYPYNCGLEALITTQGLSVYYNYDLSLAVVIITDIKHNIVAMAFPCVKLESLFRNDISDVIR